MSYMNQAEFAPAGGIQELSFDEIEQVDGAVAPLVVAGVIVGVILLAGVISGFVGEHNRDTADKK